MEDDGGNNLSENNLSEHEYKVRRRINKQTIEKKKVCRTRFDVLATPQKRNILGTFQNHACHFPKEKVMKIKNKLQEMFAMTPEETEKYFEQMRNETNEIAKQKMMKIMLKRLFKKKQKEEQERKAYRLIERLLKQGMLHAFTNPIPPLISVRLRNLSDIILEQICDLRNVDIPDRDNPNQCDSFLISVADWIAIGIEHIYYNVQLKKNEELTEIENQVLDLKGTRKKDDKKGKESKEEEDADKQKKAIVDEVQMDEYDELQELE